MFKARMKFQKEGRAKYLSHLDLMHTLQRAMARCEMPLWFTEGFNPHAYISVALPLSTGFSGEWEILDFNLLSDGVPVDALERFNAVLPEGLHALALYPVDETCDKLRDLAWSRYRVVWRFQNGVPTGLAADARALFDRDEVMILKRSKRGETEINMKERMRELTVEEREDQIELTVLTAVGNENLSPDYLTNAVRRYLPQYEIWGETYHRLCVYTKEMKPFR